MPTSLAAQNSLSHLFVTNTVHRAIHDLALWCGRLSGERAWHRNDEEQRSASVFCGLTHELLRYSCVIQGEREMKENVITRSYSLWHSEEIR